MMLISVWTILFVLLPLVGGLAAILCNRHDAYRRGRSRMRQMRNPLIAHKASGRLHI